MSVIDSHPDLGLGRDSTVGAHAPIVRPPPLPKSQVAAPALKPVPPAVSEPVTAAEPALVEEALPAEEPATEEANAAPGFSMARWLAVPSWLVSTVVHLLALLTLAVLTMPPVVKQTVTTLTVAIGEATTLESLPVAIVPKLDASEHQTALAPTSETVEATDLTHIASAAEGSGAATPVDLDAVNVGEVGELFGTGGKGMATIGGPGGGSAEFFGVKAGGRRFVFVVDSSNSMRGKKFADAKRELLYAIRRLDETQSFYVIFFDNDAERMFTGEGKEPETRPIPTTSENLRRLEKWLPTVELEYKTDPYDAMKYAVEMRPDAIYILSDGQFTDRGQTERYLAQNNLLDDPETGYRPRVVIHTIAFYSREGEPTMQAIAKAYGGTYRFVAKP